MKLTTQNGHTVTEHDPIVVFENFPSLSMSQWCVAVYHSVASYDSPYDPIIWMPKSGYMAGPKHDEVHEQNRQLAEFIAKAIKQELEG